MIRVFSFVFALIFLAARAGAQTPDSGTNAIIDGMYREADHNRSEILQKLRSVLDDREKAVLDRVRFTINRNAWNLFEVYADTNVVNVSMGFIIHVNMINGALAYEMYDSTVQNTTRNLGRPIDFANYYVDTLVANSRAPLLGRPTVPLKSYFQWLGMSASEISVLTARLNADDRYQRLFALVNEGNLAMVLAHELGHHVLGHVPVTRPLGPPEEAAADAFAFKHVAKMGYPPMLALGTFMLFDRFERRGGPEPLTTDHPPALCRWFRAMTAGWTAIKNDPELLAELGRRGRAGDVDAMNDLLKKGERQFAEQCPSASHGLCDLISRHLSDPPRTFIAERGALLDPGKWDAKYEMPNASCYVRQRQAGRQVKHGFSCVINSRNSQAVVDKYYDDTVNEIAACVGRMASAGRWSRDSDEDDDDGERTFRQEWSFTDGSTRFAVDMEKIVNVTKQEFHNYLVIEYAAPTGQ
jgi:hypothetical protein